MVGVYLKPMTDEQRAEAEKRLRAGEKKSHVAKDMGVPINQIDKLFVEIEKDVVNIDVPMAINGSKCAVMEVPKYKLALQTQAKRLGKHWLKYAGELLGMKKYAMSAACRIHEQGCDELKRRVINGELNLSRASEIAALPIATQIETLRATRREVNNDELTAFKRRVETLLDQKIFWEREHGRGADGVQVIAHEVSDDERAELVRTLNLVSDWCADVSRALQS